MNMPMSRMETLISLYWCRSNLKAFLKGARNPLNPHSLLLTADGSNTRPTPLPPQKKKSLHRWNIPPSESSPSNPLCLDLVRLKTTARSGQTKDWLAFFVLFTKSEHWECDWLNIRLSRNSLCIAMAKLSVWYCWEQATCFSITSGALGQLSGSNLGLSKTL